MIRPVVASKFKGGAELTPAARRVDTSTVGLIGRMLSPSYFVADLVVVVVVVVLRWAATASESLAGHTWAWQGAWDAADEWRQMGEMKAKVLQPTPNVIPPT